MISLVTCTPLSGLEQNSVLIDAGIWYQTNTVPDMHDRRIGLLETGAGKMESIYGASIRPALQACIKKIRCEARHWLTGSEPSMHWGILCEY